jgi:dienelactone hydrolase
MLRRSIQQGILALVALAALSTEARAQTLADTVIPLPAPRGGAAVGTTLALLADTSRRDATFAGGRPIAVQLWYPAARARGPIAPYLFDRGLGAELLRGPYYGLDTATLARWPALQTHSLVDAPVASGRHPLVTLSVGLGVIRANYTSIAEGLASRGMIVMLVESPLAGLMVLPNGRVVQDTTSQLQAAANHRAAVTTWARDVVFSLDRLQAARGSDAMANVAPAVDWTRVGAMGHSSGGLVAVQACELDARIRACVDMDGGMATPTGEPMADFVSTGTAKPTLLLRSEPVYSEADFARRGMTRAQWEQRGAAGRVAIDSVVSRAHAPFWVASVRGTGHFSFTDAPFVMPTTITRFGGRIIAPERGLDVIVEALGAFFDEAWGTRPNALAAVTRRFAEFTLSTAPHR